MSSKVVVVRHGNTFAAGETAVMVGANEDLPLTSEGEMQATRMGSAIAATGIVPAIILCGPLERTRRFADLIAAQYNVAPKIDLDERLRELDFGKWSGLSNDEIKNKFGADELSRWNERGERPTSFDFKPSAEQVQRDAQSILNDAELSVGITLVVSSNGILREFGKLCAGDADTFAGFKTRTGHGGVLVRDESGWKIKGWNVGGEEIAALLLDR